MGLIGFTTKRDEILFGSKTCTTRLARKRPLKPYELLQLYWKLRTKECKRLGSAYCEDVTGFTWASLQVLIETDAEYRKREGGFTPEELTEWFVSHYKPTSGTLFEVIRWRDFVADSRWLLVKKEEARWVPTRERMVKALLEK